MMLLKLGYEKTKLYLVNGDAAPNPVHTIPYHTPTPHPYTPPLHRSTVWAGLGWGGVGLGRVVGEGKGEVVWCGVVWCGVVVSLCKVVMPHTGHNMRQQHDNAEQPWNRV